MTETALRLRGVAVDLGGRPVLRDVNLDVSGGRLLAVVGPNGAGKTTLLRAILGLIPAQGEITVPVAQGKRMRDVAGYVPQRHDVAWDYPISVENMVMTGRTTQLGWFRHPKLADHRAVAAALKRVQMQDLATRPVGELSGGQRQRVLIARALSTAPSLLLLDEPFTGLDMPTQELLTELFRTLADEGTTIMMTTHDLPAAMATCDDIAMVSGTIVAQGSPAELRDAELWMSTFQVSERSPLLASLGIAPQEVPC